MQTISIMKGYDHVADSGLAANLRSWTVDAHSPGMISHIGSTMTVNELFVTYVRGFNRHHIEGSVLTLKKAHVRLCAVCAHQRNRQYCIRAHAAFVVCDNSAKNSPLQWFIVEQPP